MTNSTKSPVLELAAQKLRRRIFQHAEGAYLGLESDLIAQLGVSRPTFRQVARLLEHEGLLVIRKGNQGGFYGARPDADSIANHAITFILTRQTSPFDVISTSSLVMVEIVRDAAACGDDSLRRSLERQLEEDRRSVLESPLQVRLEAAFSRQLIAMCQRPMLGLFAIIAANFHERHSINFQHLRERMPIWRQLRLQLGEAVISQDAPLAMQVCRTRYDIMKSWLEEDRGPEGVLTPIGDIGLSVDELPTLPARV